MTVTCPQGHASATTDYCDQCGAPIGRAASTEIPAVPEEADTSASTSPAARREPCPACGAPRAGDDRYCESCGYDFLAPPRAPAVWEAVVTTDRRQFERFAQPGLTFPADSIERRFALEGAAVRIGRSRGGTSEAVAEIDLAHTTEDPGVSRLHAVLERQDDGTYALRDLGSTNGTTVNDDPTPVGTDAAVRLAAGDRIRVGAWTTITVSEVVRAQ
jgi:hypothetical protein